MSYKANILLVDDREENLTALDSACEFVNKDVKVDASKLYEYWKDAG